MLDPEGKIYSEYILQIFFFLGAVCFSLKHFD